jgi:heat shock protein HspQ
MYLNFSIKIRLIEFGIFQEGDINGSYAIGQSFLHRLYDYRGIILFNCSFDKNKNVNLKNHTYYKCLIDGRDINYIVRLLFN